MTFHPGLPRAGELKVKGQQSVLRLPGKGGGRCGFTSPRLLAGVAAVVFLGSSTSVFAAVAAQGDAVVNVATISANGFASMTSGPATVKVRIPSPPKIELMLDAPRTGSAEQVASGAYMAGSPSGALTVLPAPTGSATGPISLAASVPLAGTSFYHQGDPIFIRVTELDENMDRLARETVLVTVTADLTGDKEMVRLTEDGPDTGVFVGYIPTRRGAVSDSTCYDGVLSLVEKTTITARYVDSSEAAHAVQAQAGVDPFSVVFDSKTGQPVNGAQVTVVDVASGQPAKVLSDDGQSSFPSTVTSGQEIKDGAGRAYTFAAGEFRFPILAAGSYRYEVKAPSGYAAPSKATDAQLAKLGSFTVVNPGSRGEAFQLDGAPFTHIDIPVDPSGVALWVTKTASKDTAGIGDFLAYQIAVTDADKATGAANVHVHDFLPVGFRYKKASAQLNGVAVADPSVSPDGRTLDFSFGNVDAGTTSTVTFVAQIGAGAVKGQFSINLASAVDAGNGGSNLAQAAVKVTDDFFSSKSFLMGRVTTGACGEDGQGQIGVPGVRILLEDGTFAGTDKQGLYHFEGVTTGTHVVQIDLDSLPEGYEAVSCVKNDRFAGRAFSQFVDLAGGSLWRADFHLQPVAKPPPPPAAPSPPPPPPPPPPPDGEVGVSLNHTLDGLAARFSIAARGARASMPDAKLRISLPKGLVLEPGSSAMNGIQLAEPKADGDALVYDLGALPAYWLEVVSFRAQVAADAAEADLPVSAALEGTDGSAKVTSPSAVNQLKVAKLSTQKPLTLVIRPHFPSFGTELSKPDKQQLDQLAQVFSNAKAERIVVVGHTDSTKIRRGSQAIYKDNAALSLGRAQSVGGYLAKVLHFPPSSLSYEGRGEKEPVASNDNLVGRAMNRRVEVTAFAATTEEKTVLVSVDAASGEQRAAVVHTAVAEALQAAAANVEAKATAPAAVRPASAQEPVAVTAGTATVTAGTATVSAGTATVSAGTATVTAGTATVAAEPAAQGRAGLADSASGSLAAGGPIPAHSAQIPSSQMPPNDGLALTPPALQKPLPPPADGIVSPADGDLIADRIGSVQVRATSYLAVTLSVDGKEVDASRIGYKSEDHNTGKTTYTFVGVDFGTTGAHEVTVIGKDPFGNARLKQTAHLVRTGEIARIRFLSADDNVADGKTPVKARIELEDARGNAIRGSIRLDLKEGNLAPLRREGEKVTLDQSVGRQVAMDKDGNVAFAPVTTSGSYRAVLSAGGSTVEIETWAKPKMRDWVLVGLAEGTAGYAALTGNSQTLADDGVDQNLYTDGRVAFYAKGQVQGKWLVTLEYDSARNPHPSEGLFNQIDPNTYFTLYGDGSQQGYDAASARKVYVKIEREQFYALFGDFDTGLTVTELSRYTRKLNGVKSELSTKFVEANAFGAETDQAYARDEIPGDGTSGLYRLSHQNIGLNTETVTILTRDRFRSEVIVSSVVMTRFTDYSIDYDGGSIFFREPISSRDENLNPITIVVEYETGLLGKKDLTAGGRVGVKLLDNRVKAGVSVIHEGQGDRQNDLVGADVKIQLDHDTRLRGEYAVTDSRAIGVAANVGSAFLAELDHTTKQLDAKAYIREEQGAYGLGQQAFAESGTRKFGVESAYRLDQHYTLSGQAYRQDTFSTGAERLFAEERFGWQSGGYSAYAGILNATDHLAAGSFATGPADQTSGQVEAGGKLTTLHDKLVLSLDYAQSVWGNGSVDFPTRIDGRAEYKLSKHLSLLGDEEVTFGDGAITNTARLGFRSSLWQGGTLTSTVDRSLNENEARVFGNVGLRQTVQLSQAWKVDAGAERTLTVHRTDFYAVNPAVPAASGVAGVTPTSSEDFTAVSVGANYQVKKLVWDSRVEARTATYDDKWSVTSGVIAERNDGWAWSGRAQYLGTSASGQHSTSGDLRLGLVYRPAQTHWIVLNRLDGIIQSMDAATAASSVPAPVPGAGTPNGAVAAAAAATTPTVSALGSTGLAAANLGIDSWRVVDNLVANFRPRKDLQLSLGYGIKYGREVVQGAMYQGFTDQPSIEGRYDLNEMWDIGLRASALQVFGLHQTAFSAGPSVGLSPATNVWVSAGYNVIGYSDQDFSASNATAAGPYVQMRFKFDQQSVKDAAGWINKQ
jgi:uncharacterized repeat protein (TIGR01451 family)